MVMAIRNGIVRSAGMLLVSALIAPPLWSQSERQSPPFQIAHGSFVAIQVADIDAAAEWYQDAFALREVNRVEREGQFSIRILDSAGVTMELIEMVGAAEVPDRHLGLFKSGFFVDDIDAAFAWFEQRSPSNDQTVFVDQALRSRSFVTKDPFGNRLQFFSRCDGPCEEP